MQPSSRKHPAADCENCPLQGEKYVPSLIPESPRLVAVGEAPGFQEAVRGQPFTGPSGKLLDRVLGHYDYPRSDVMYTNVVACRPPENATPPATAIHACRPRLLTEIEQANMLSGCDTVLALGSPAMKATINSGNTITAERVGPPKKPGEALWTAGIRSVIPTWHPAYCLRNPDAFPTLVSDLGKIGRDPIPWEPPRWKYFDEPEIAEQALEGLLEYQDLEGKYELVIDIETGLDKSESYDHPNNYELLCIGIGYAKGRAIVIGKGALVAERIKELLTKLLRRSKLVGHNLKFDLQGLYPYIKGLSAYFDTMLAHYALDERSGGPLHGLEVLAIELLGAPDWKAEIKKFVPTKKSSYANVPKEILYKYNAFDVACTWDLYELFVPQLNHVPDDWPYEWAGLPAKTPRDAHDFMVGAANQLMFLELNGMPVDRVYNLELTNGFLAQLTEIEQEINLHVKEATNGEIVTLNPRSPKQIMAFFATQKITTDSTDADHLERILGRLDPNKPTARMVSTLLRHRREQKLYGTFVKGIRQRMYRGRVYTTYMLHGTTSGRLSSCNPNLQNIVRSKAIRRQFSVSKEENVLIQGDYSQAEGRIICWLAQDEYLRAIFSDPTRDIFDELSDQLYGPGNWAKEERVRTKAYFYGLGYGREAYSIALEYGWSVKETEVRLKQFKDLIPAVVRWQEQIKKDVHSGKDLITPFGRRRRFWLITKENRKEVENEALSYLPQSTASDICLGALVRLRPMLRGRGFIRLTIHDALVAECSRDLEGDVSALLKSEMVKAAARLIDYVPFKVDISTGRTWGDL